MRPGEGSLFDERSAQRIVLFAVALSIFIVPFRIVGLGYEPRDDARRHAAKVISGKEWPEILVVRPEYRIDPHPGWHAILGGVQRAGIESTRGLIGFSVVALALLLLLTPVPFLERPEAWLATLLSLAVLEPSAVARAMLGRPLLLSMAALAWICLIWPRLDGERISWRLFAGLSGALALSAWAHGSAYLWGLPVLAFFAAGKWRAAARLAAALALGFLAAAALSGAPVDYVVQAVQFPFWALGEPVLRRLLVGEFQPSAGAPLLLLGAVVLFSITRRKGKVDERPLADPVLLLALAGWALGFLVRRFWLDWGLVATAIWMTRRIEGALVANVDRGARARIWWVFGAAFAMVAAWTSDLGNRWTREVGRTYLNAANQEEAEWLPGPGGILYNDSMISFYETFSRNPRAGWRYVVGFEPTLMPAEDRAIHRRIRLTRSAASYEPWARKLGPGDRLLVRSDKSHPAIEGIEWRRMPNREWIGRLAPEGREGDAVRERRGEDASEEMAPFGDVEESGAD